MTKSKLIAEVAKRSGATSAETSQVIAEVAKNKGDREIIEASSNWKGGTPEVILRLNSNN